jgi:excisionase family DNA binding protein
VKSLEHFIAELVATLVRAELEKNRPSDAGGLTSIERAADRLDVSPSMIRKAIREKQLIAYRVGACVRVRIADVDALAVRADKPDEVQTQRERVLRIARGGRP